MSLSWQRREFLRWAISAGVVAAGYPPSCGWADPPGDAATGGKPGTGESPWPDHPFLSGNFAPVREEVAVADLKVIGELPAELDGMYLRNGPNPQFPPPGSYHWFEGDGMIHGVRVRDGRASYLNRYVRTTAWNQEHAAGKALYGSFLDPPDLKAIFAGRQPFKNAANTNVVWHGGRLLALWEGGEPYELTLPDLKTVGPCHLQGKWTTPFTAHPKIDPATGEMMFFGYSPVRPYVRYGVLDRRGRLVHTTPIDLPRLVLMHDFAITPRHTIFMDLPEVFSLARVARGEFVFQFEPRHGARLGVLARRAKGDTIRWFEIDTCFVFHTLNAYDDGDEVVLEACRFDEYPESLFGFNGKPPKLSGYKPNVRLHRWRMNLKTGQVAEAALDDRPSEMPRVADARLGRKTRYGYGIEIEGAVANGAIKFDLAAGKHQVHPFGKHRLGGELVFVPRPQAKGDRAASEDDGWLVNYVHDAESGRSEMVVLDARHFTDRPLARVLLPARVPHGFHSTWVPGEQLPSPG